MCAACWRASVKELDARVAGAGGNGADLIAAAREASSNQLTGQLEALSPLAILDRGYALVFDSSGVLLKDADQVKAGDEISARLAKGTRDRDGEARKTEVAAWADRPRPSTFDLAIRLVI